MGTLGKVGFPRPFPPHFTGCSSDLSGLRVQWQVVGAQTRVQVGKRRAGVTWKIKTGGEVWQGWERGRVRTEVPWTPEIESAEQEPVSEGRSG